jgi:hypothetical protein
VEQGIPAGEPADPGHEEPITKNRAAPRRARVGRAASANRDAARRSNGRSWWVGCWASDGHDRASVRYCTSASISSAFKLEPYDRHHAGGEPGGEHGLGIDDRLADVLLDRHGRLGSGGEVVEARAISMVVPAGVTRGTRRSPALADLRPSPPAALHRPALPPPRTPRRARPGTRRSACSTTRTGARMVACPSPQSSVQINVKLPVRVRGPTILVVTPGRRSCFWPISGIQNEWITSAAVISNSSPRSTGARARSSARRRRRGR